MITINSNASAMMAQNNLFKSQAALTGNMQQLSTGLRINSASDDAAGMQIANRMETQMNGLDVAQRNANDGISMAQTAEGAMTENTTILNRMRDLSLQSANDTNKTEDRKAMQKEIDSLISEVDRIAETTNFAGINLLDGSKAQGEDGTHGLSFQIGSNAGETIEFSIADMSASGLGLAGEGFDYTDATVADIDDIAWKAEEGTGIIKVETNATVAIEFEGQESVDVELTADMTEAQVQAEFEGALGAGVVITAGDDGKSETGIDLSGLGEKTYELTSIGGNVVSDAVEAEDVAIDVTTSVGAQSAITVLDSALAKVDDERANLGAVQNRLESTVSNLSNIEENLGVAQSRIQDADFASQTVEMTSNQMLMQAGTSVLAQAKGMPQYATMLL